MIGVAVLGVALALCGLISMVSTLLGGAEPRRSWHVLRVAQIQWRRVFTAAAVGVAAGLVTRWPVSVVAAAALSWWFPTLLRSRARGRVEQRTEAIAAWCDLLKDAAGTARGLAGMLVVTAPSGPLPIRPAVERMAHRLEFEPVEEALTGLADDLDHPLGDLVATALRLAATAGSRRVRQVLDDLATAAHAEAAMAQRIDVARQRPRTTMRLVALVITGFVTLLALFAREYLAPYGNPLGQMVLLLVGSYWALGFWWMQRMGRMPTVERFLARREARP